MKKNNGFMLFETLIVSSLILGTLVFLYVQITSIKKSYNTSFRFDTVEGLYKADQIAKYLEKTGYSSIKTALAGKSYIDITSCVYSSTLCSNLLKEADVKKIIFAVNDPALLKENLSEFKKDFKKYIQLLKKTKTKYDYRIIVEYNDKTFASAGVGIDLSELNTYTVSNIVNNNGFEGGNSNWTTTGSSNSVTIDTNFKKSGTKSLNIRTSNEAENKVSQVVALKANHVYYQSEVLYLNKSQSGFTNIYLNSANNYVNIQYSTLKAKKWNYISSVFKATTAGNYSYNIVNLNSINNVYVDNVMLIDLTEAFGAGLEPDLKWCDSHINYFTTTLTLYK